jgi:hypothetical protein
VGSMERLTTIWAALLMGTVAYFAAGLGAMFTGQTDAISTVDWKGHLFFIGFSVIPFLVPHMVKSSFKDDDTLKAAIATQPLVLLGSIAAQYYMFCHLADDAQAAIGFVVLPMYLGGLAAVVLILARLVLFLKRRFSRG